MKRSQKKSIIVLIYNIICHCTPKEYHSYFCFNGKKTNVQPHYKQSPFNPRSFLGGSSLSCQSKRWPSGVLDKPGSHGLIICTNPITCRTFSNLKGLQSLQKSECTTKQSPCLLLTLPGRRQRQVGAAAAVEFSLNS